MLTYAVSVGGCSFGRLLARSVFLFAVSFPLFGCETDDYPSDPTGPEGFDHSLAPINPRQGQSLDDRFAEIARRVPGFGGVFFDQTGQLTVYMRDPSRAPAARTAISQVFGSRDLPLLSARVIVGKYDFTELKHWHDSAIQILRLPGTASLDIDDSNNRIRIGVTSQAARNVVLEELSRLGVPEEAVIIEQTSLTEQQGTLRDRLRAINGGIQIAKSNNVTCTLGFLAKRAGVWGLVTASHCTAVQGGVESTRFYQNVFSSSNLVGTETVDPNYIGLPGCPPGRRCRYSDAAFAALPAGFVEGNLDDYDAGEVRTTNFRGRTTGSITIAAERLIDREISDPFMGEELNKVGRSSGWTYGNVSAVCVTENVDQTDITMLCSDRVSAGSQGGDSGSPVFKLSSKPGRVDLYGVLWGRNNDANAFVFSAMSNIEQELGNLGTEYFVN